MKTMAMLAGGGMGGARELAEMIRRLGRGRDTILAHITPEEADLLRKLGGSGKTNPQTGLPEFQEEFDLDAGMDYTPDYSGFSEFDFDAGMDFTPQFEAAIEPAAPGVDFMGAQARLPAAERGVPLPGERAPVAGMELPQPTERTTAQRIEDALQRVQRKANENPLLTRLGVGAASGLSQALMARRARREAEGMAARERTAGAPFRAAAQEASARASAGGMTPQEQRAFEAAQARARQGLSQRNMTQGSAAAGIQAGQKARATSEARARAMSEAMRNAGIADQYEGRALQLQLSSDKALNDILGEVLAREVTAATRQQAPAPR
jgi:hypothetical protein